MENTENHAIRITGTFNVPLQLMWEVWTDPEHLMHWWGPNGFTMTINTMDFNEGGEWNLTLQNLDGTDFPHRSVFKEIIPFRKIVFEHFNPHFTTTILFEFKDEETWLDWTMVFDTAEMRESVIKEHKTDEGQEQAIDKLEKYLAKLLINDSQ
ncbi:MAG: polyketide cyclase [Candidatus Fluviicola riflensis]|nr:MAG: polyketide cyclase [Candidatus Fluviicola riflensis]OGS79893.1 MAG: polyketide cyclase [Candidatus Fluviicola riflensis]OGS82408.1 MAG: polyketide cyclase [Fluviicola sp. RIFCSPHIGHO2_01_FULL_43_53]OGS88072.1 MAG: polyketide cyclase [Fluviicola sp. RIFCSPHIGHO2_12_FULL_43_24]